MISPADRIAERWLRGGLAFVWLATGLSVLHPHYRTLGLEFLAPTGLPDWIMWATCAGEVALGLRVAFGPPTTWIVGLQLALILGFTAILTTTQPRLWLDPLGPLPKNLPLLGLLATAWLLHREGWTPRARGWLRGAVAVFWFVAAWLHWLAHDEPYVLLTLAAATCCLRGRALRILVLIEALAILHLLAIGTRQDPLLWVHPFGPLTKMIPVLIAAWWLARLQ